MANDSEEVLNPFQQRRLRVTMAEVDRLLSNVEQVLNASASKSPFPKFIPDFTDAQRKTIEDYIRRIRTRLVRVLEEQGITPDPPSIPATRAVHSALTFIDIAVEELRPRYMRGYGEVPPKAAAELDGIVGELAALVQQLDRYATQSGQDLKQRLIQLESAGRDVELLKLIERIISEHGLVEFRSTLAMVLSRLEDTSFEIAVFGRVSSGKSSLLNAVLGNIVLPVGVTPITAVPTRIIYGEEPGVVIWFPDRRPEQYDIGQLGEFASEGCNPGNTKHVSRIVVQLPSPWLKGGVAFVDTPGLGSLAVSGAKETMAYLPRCDLGVVLIDASTTLSTNDLQIIEALYTAGIPANVLLSKADLLVPQDLDRVLKYTAEHLQSELRLDPPVRPVSVIDSHRHLLDRWFEEQIMPLFDQRQELRTASVRRKVGALREAVEAALRSRLQRAGQRSSLPSVDARSLDADLRRATTRIEEAEAKAQRIAETISARTLNLVIERAAERLATARAEQNPATHAAAVIQQATLQAVQEQATVIQQTLETLADELTRQLELTAQTLETPNRPAEDEFRSLIREMPVLNLGTLNITLNRSSLPLLLGRRFAARQLGRRLARQAGPQLSNALAAYGRLLGDWCGTILTQLRRRFATYADGYRAQAERSLGPSEMSSEERRAIERDLEFLAALSPV